MGTSTNLLLMLFLTLSYGASSEAVKNVPCRCKNQSQSPPIKYDIGNFISYELDNSTNDDDNHADIDAFLQAHIKKLNQLREFRDETFNDDEDYSDKLTNRVYNGQKAQRGMFPSQVRLYTTYNNGQYGSCGGSLIRRNWILTAAHCVTEPNKPTTGIQAIIGVVDSRDSRRVVRKAVRYFFHERYSSTELINDIALVKIEPVELNQFIQLSTPPPRNLRNDDIIGQTVVLSGFGKINDNTHTDELYWGKIKVAPLKRCQDYYYTRADIFCLDPRGASSSCPGDSGGPLFWTDPNNKVVQIGVTSFGSRASCTQGAYVGYTRISGYMDWILNIINSN